MVIFLFKANISIIKTNKETFHKANIKKIVYFPFYDTTQGEVGRIIFFYVCDDVFFQIGNEIFETNPLFIEANNIFWSIFLGQWKRENHQYFGYGLIHNFQNKHQKMNMIKKIILSQGTRT